ncbi:MAG TPA: preprotein translocase subunit SecE [Candidatus Paceibacterota bacterium]|nr:preprotein translocase subunit SecE [Candidatus Paceibacterota bacterium]
MANPIIQYFKDTRSELNHVAWPTQRQTVIYTTLVALISLFIAAYLGAFDEAFTAALARVVGAQGSTSSGIQVTQQPTSNAAPTTTQAPAASGPTFGIPGATPSSGSTQ